MPKRAIMSCATMRAGLHDQSGREPGHDLAQRQVNGDGNDRELGRPQHHDRMRALAARPLRELGQIFGVAGLGEAGAVEDILGDRIGDEGGGPSGQHVGDRAVDGGERRRRAAGVRTAGLRGDGDPDIDHRQGGAERRRGRARLDHGERDIEPEVLGPLGQEFRISEEVESRKRELRAPPPGRQGDVGADPRRLAQRQPQGQGHRGRPTWPGPARSAPGGAALADNASTAARIFG